MGFINAAVNDLRHHKNDWPPAQSLEAYDFVEQTIEEIRWLLGISEEYGRQVAMRLWQGLREELNTEIGARAARTDRNAPD